MRSRHEDPSPAPGLGVRSQDHDETGQGPQESGSRVAAPVRTKLCSRTPELPGATARAASDLN